MSAFYPFNQFVAKTNEYQRNESKEINFIFRLKQFLLQYNQNEY